MAAIAAVSCRSCSEKFAFPVYRSKRSFNRTRIAVTRVSRADQVPWISSSLAEDFFLVPGAFGSSGGASSPLTSSPLATASRPVNAPPPPPPPPVTSSPPVYAPPSIAAPREQEATSSRPVDAPAPAATAPPAPAPPLPKEATPAQSTLPDFPWPPPRASTSYVLPDDLLKAYHRIGDVEHAIEQALEQTGYVERAFFHTPSGIAMVTRLERIQPDGTSMTNDRWPISPSRYELQVGLMTFLRGLFFVPPGHYRLIVFIMQDKPFNQSTRCSARTRHGG